MSYEPRQSDFFIHLGLPGNPASSPPYSDIAPPVPALATQQTRPFESWPRADAPEWGDTMSAPGLPIVFSLFSNWRGDL
jgi:hypothetical protein